MYITSCHQDTAVRKSDVLKALVKTDECGNWVGDQFAFIPVRARDAADAPKLGCGGLACLFD